LPLMVEGVLNVAAFRKTFFTTEARSHGVKRFPKS
jgi:hypothetical protein